MIKIHSNFFLGTYFIFQRYQAFQFYTYSKELKAERNVQREILDQLIHHDSFIITANIR